jgi:hypothetical protein
MIVKNNQTHNHQKPMNPSHPILEGRAGRAFFLLLSLALLTAAAQAQVPTMISYQSRVQMNNTNFGGTGQFKFALVNNNGTVTFWSNDGSSVAGSQPAAAVSLPVANGLVMTILGDTSIANMTALPASAFVNADVRLRVWFNGGSGFQQLTPDQRIVSVGYALMAGNVPDGSITAAKLAPGAVGGVSIANNSVGSAQLADDLDLGSASTLGHLDIYRTSANTPAITLDGATSAISTFGSDGLEQIRLHGVSWGELLLHNSLPNNAIAVNLTAQGSTGGRLTLANTNGSNRAILEGENVGGTLTLYTADGNIGALLYGNEGQGSGALSLRDTNGSPRFRAYGGPNNGRLELLESDGGLGAVIYGDVGNGAGAISLKKADSSTGLNLYGGPSGSVSLYNNAGSLAAEMYCYNGIEGTIAVRNSAGDQTVYLWGRDSDGTGDGQIGLKKASGTETVTIQAGEGAGGAQLLMRNAAGVQTVQLDSDASGVACGYLALYRSNGVATIIMDADGSGDGRVTTQVLQITGGSDLSENFEINSEKDSLEPGMIVSIDPKNVGELVLSQTACDKRVAGIISGAGGVKTGMLMGQAGTKADGKHPVALTGRVYCWVDADAGGPVEAGDLITSSNTPGHGMKVTDHARAAGAIIGKAMSSLEKGKGLVLVLVSLQ